MAIICVICTDVLAFSNILSTKCGHVFHSDCLLKWLRRSKTCPQCRENVIHDELYRIYFSFANSEDDLNLPPQSKNKVIESYKKANKKLQKKKQNQDQIIRKLKESETVLRSELHVCRQVNNTLLGNLLEQDRKEYIKNQRIRYLEKCLMDGDINRGKLIRNTPFIRDLVVFAVLHIICNCSIDFFL